MQIIRDKVYVERLMGRRIQMVSGQGQQVFVEMWDYIIDNEQMYWFWPTLHDEPGAMVHCGSIIAGHRSEGYGGSMLKFPTKDGVISIQGPWHSNTDALFEKTGIDLRDKHRTVGAIALARAYEGNETVFMNVVYLDPDEGVIGTFDRIGALAQQMSDANDTPLYCYRRSAGGSSNGPVYPTGWSSERKREFHRAEVTCT